MGGEPNCHICGAHGCLLICQNTKQTYYGAKPLFACQAHNVVPVHPNVARRDAGLDEIPVNVADKYIGEKLSRKND